MIRENAKVQSPPSLTLKRNQACEKIVSKTKLLIWWHEWFDCVHLDCGPTRPTASLPKLTNKFFYNETNIYQHKQI